VFLLQTSEMLSNDKSCTIYFLTFCLPFKNLKFKSFNGHPYLDWKQISNAVIITSSTFLSYLFKDICVYSLSTLDLLLTSYYDVYKMVHDQTGHVIFASLTSNISASGQNFKNLSVTYEILKWWIWLPKFELCSSNTEGAFQVKGWRTDKHTLNNNSTLVLLMSLIAIII